MVKESESNETVKGKVQAEDSEPQKNKKDNKNSSNGDSDSEYLGSSTVYYMHCFLLFCGRFLNKVLDFYNSLFEVSPKDKAKIYRNVSTHYAKKGMHEKAIEYLKEWAKLEPANPESYYQLGVALAASGNNKSAIGAFKKVLKLNPAHKGAIYRKSAIHLKMKDYQGAVEGLESLLKTEANNAKVYYLLGIAYDALGVIDKAISVMQKAVELEPENIKYHQHLGFLNVRKDDHQTAAKHFTKVMELEREFDEENINSTEDEIDD